MFDFEEILQQAKSRTLPPVSEWNPKLSGDIDINIDKFGVWSHEGVNFTRKEIPHLFSRILCREGDEYFLKTPVEKWRIRVEEVPFTLVHLQINAESTEQQLCFFTEAGDGVVLDQQHPLRVEVDRATQEPSPYLSVRGGMEGKLTRSVFYQLVEMAEIDEITQTLYVYSAGCRFDIGSIAE